MGASLHVRPHPEAPKRCDASGCADSGIAMHIRSEQKRPRALAPDDGPLRSVRTPRCGERAGLPAE